MLPLAYTESLDLKEHLREIDRLRATILAIPLSPKSEMKFRWEAKATRIHSSLALTGNQMSRGQVVKVLSTPTKHIPADYRDVLAYKQALEFIENHWVASTKPVTFASVLSIATIGLAQSAEAVERSVRSSEVPLKTVLEYLENQKDHPVIQAGIALILLSTDAAVAGDGGLVARLVSSMFLAKYGYDLRGLITVEKHWLSAGSSYETAIASHHKQGNLNHFLAFFAQTMEENLTERFDDLTQTKLHGDLPASFWDLNDRQKEILTYLEEPTSTLSNKKVQTMFTISQITASRDLTKLATLGLLYPHGKGRSVSYTRS